MSLLLLLDQWGGKGFAANNLKMSIKVCQNPVVAAAFTRPLAFLFASYGCYKEWAKDGTIINQECETESIFLFHWILHKTRIVDGRPTSKPIFRNKLTL
jgi:hypothetical protein